MTLLSLLLSAGLASAGPAAALDRRPDLVVPGSIQLPAAAASAPEVVPITAPWRLVLSAGGVRTWEVPLPVRPRTLYFTRAPGDMAVQRDGKRQTHVPLLEKTTRSGTWTFTSHALQVRRPAADGPPRPGEYTVTFSEATELEDALRYDPATPAEAFVFRQLQLDDTTRTGLLLPAPASVDFQVTVPDGGAVLDLEPLLLPPEAGDPGVRSDGARLAVYINDERVVSWGLHATGSLGQRRVRLSPWSGQQVTVRLATEPGPRDDAALDYVFVVDPVVHVPQADPPRVVVIFIDTLRADHMSLYGYARATTPRLDRWAEDAAVFTEARSVAPWTLPSARTMVTGAHPEQWGRTGTIQARLAQEGWATTFIAGNIYLSSGFEMARDWGSHRCVNLPIASVQVGRALDYLQDHSDRPVFMMLHFMDMHLPYSEPLTYRYTFAGKAPADLPAHQFHRWDVLEVVRKLGGPGKQYIQDRYDNNLRYIDDQLARVLRTLDDNDTVLIVADHGEEFWDHGEFEHGHSLYDELLRVPLIARGPSFTPGRFDAPVSLLDVTPSILAALGLELDGPQGLPLQTLADGSATAQFRDRPQAFGRPLYGVARWGSLLHDQKYLAWEGKEALYDLQTDPGESAKEPPSREAAAAGQAAMAAALGAEVPLAFRLEASRRNSDKKDLEAILTVPGGIRTVWITDDATQRSRSTFEKLSEDTVKIVWEGSYALTREVYVEPTLPAEVAVVEATLSLASSGDTIEASRGRITWPPPYTGQGLPLLRGRVSGRTVDMTYAVAPRPADDQAGGLIADPCAVVKTCFELLALGYTDDCDQLIAQNPGCAD